MIRTFKLTDWQNWDSNNTNISYLTNLNTALLMNTAFQYDGFPNEETPSYMLEIYLYYYGFCVLFEYNNKIHLLPFALDGELDEQGQWISGKPISYQSKEYPRVFISGEKQNAVLFKNNVFGYPTKLMLRPYINRMAYIWKTLGKAEQGLRMMGFIIASNPEVRNALQAEIDNASESKHLWQVIYDKTLMGNETQIMPKTYNGEDIKNIWYDFDKVKSELLTILGIESNPDNGKMERQITGEIKANNALTELNAIKMLQFRQKGLDEAKRIFPELFSNASVKFFGKTLDDYLNGFANGEKDKVSIGLQEIEKN